MIKAKALALSDPATTRTPRTLQIRAEKMHCANMQDYVDNLAAKVYFEQIEKAKLSKVIPKFRSHLPGDQEFDDFAATPDSGYLSEWKLQADQLEPKYLPPEQREMEWRREQKDVEWQNLRKEQEKKAEEQRQAKAPPTLSPPSNTTHPADTILYPHAQPVPSLSIIKNRPLHETFHDPGFNTQAFDAAPLFHPLSKAPLESSRVVQGFEQDLARNELRHKGLTQLIDHRVANVSGFPINAKCRAPKCGTPALGSREADEVASEFIASYDFCSSDEEDDEKEGQWHWQIDSFPKKRQMQDGPTRSVQLVKAAPMISQRKLGELARAKETAEAERSSLEAEAKMGLPPNALLSLQSGHLIAKKLGAPNAPTAEPGPEKMTRRFEQKCARRHHDDASKNSYEELLLQ